MYRAQHKDNDLHTKQKKEGANPCCQKKRRGQSQMGQTGPARFIPVIHMPPLSWAVMSVGRRHGDNTPQQLAESDPMEDYLN